MNVLSLLRGEEGITKLETSIMGAAFLLLTICCALTFLTPYLQ